MNLNKDYHYVIYHYFSNFYVRLLAKIDDMQGMFLSHTLNYSHGQLWDFSVRYSEYD